MVKSLAATEESSKEVDFKRVKWRSVISFETYGVRIGIRSNNERLIANLAARLPGLFPSGLRTIATETADFVFSLYVSPRRKSKSLGYRNDENVIGGFGPDDLDGIESQIRITVAEFAQHFIFLHAGVVGYRGRAIIIPGKSFSGKTTLVAEFAKRGLDYYSDEYAVIDKNGFVHPFAKKLSLRGIIDDYQQVDIDVEELGGRKGVTKLEVGLILVSKYKKNARFRLEPISAGAGMIVTIANSVSIRQNPEYVLGILSLITNRARILRTERNEAGKFVERFLKHLDEIDY